MRWDSWDAPASKKWMRMEESGRVDDEGRPILEKVDLIEAFFAGVHRQILIMFGEDRVCVCLTFSFRPRSRP